MSYIVELYTQCMSDYWYTDTCQGICLVLKSIGNTMCQKTDLHSAAVGYIYIIYLSDDVGDITCYIQPAVYNILYLFARTFKLVYFDHDFIR